MKAYLESRLSLCSSSRHERVSEVRHACRCVAVHVMKAYLKYVTLVVVLRDKIKRTYTEDGLC